MSLKPALSPEERRKWHIQLLIATLIILIAIVIGFHLANQADLHFRKNFRSVVTQLNELSKKSAHQAEDSRQEKSE